MDPVPPGSVTLWPCGPSSSLLFELQFPHLSVLLLGGLQTAHSLVYIRPQNLFGAAFVTIVVITLTV